MGLAAAGFGEGQRVHRHVIAAGATRRIERWAALDPGGPGIIDRAVVGDSSAAGKSIVVVRGHLRFQQGHVLLSAHLAQVTQAEPLALALLHGRVALHVWQGEVALAVASVSGSQQREQRSVLADREKLAITERPAYGREVKGENPDFSYKLV